jgi:Arc/MetJ-type ribon-helix-helix transcriptional regulator
MAIVLSPEVEQQIEELVLSDGFASADECVRDVLRRHLERREAVQRRRDEVRQLVAEGVAALESGDYTEYDDESLKTLAEEIKREARAERKLPQAS